MPDIQVALPNFPPTSPKTSTAPLSNLQLLSFEEGVVLFHCKKKKKRGLKTNRTKKPCQKTVELLFSKVFWKYFENTIAAKVYQCNDIQTARKLVWDVWVRCCNVARSKCCILLIIDRMHQTCKISSTGNTMKWPGKTMTLKNWWERTNSDMYVGSIHATCLCVSSRHRGLLFRVQKYSTPWTISSQKNFRRSAVLYDDNCSKQKCWDSAS